MNKFSVDQGAGESTCAETEMRFPRCLGMRDGRAAQAVSRDVVHFASGIGGVPSPTEPLRADLEGAHALNRNPGLQRAIPPELHL